MSDALATLVELTPLPPETSDPDELLAAFAAMFDARQEVIAQIEGPLARTPEASALIAELAARDAAWEKALHDARTAVGDARRGAVKLRAYAR